MSRRLTVLLVAATVIVSLAASPTIAAPYKYKITKIPRLENKNASGSEINEAGQVIGDQSIDDYGRPFFYSGGTSVYLTGVPPYVAPAIAMNSLGEVFGTIEDSNWNGVYLYRGGQFTEIVNPEVEFRRAYDINDSGQMLAACSPLSEPNLDTVCIVDGGQLTLIPRGHFDSLGGSWISSLGSVAGSGFQGNYSHAFLYSNGRTQDLGAPDGGESFGQAINKSNVVVGRLQFADGVTHAFRYANGVMTDLGALGGDYADPSVVNSAGVVGGSGRVSNGDTHAFISKGNQLIDLNPDGSIHSYVSDVTDNGQVVGSFGGNIFLDSRAFAYGVGGTGVADLNSLVDPNDPLKPHVTLFSANDVNEFGQILASGRDTRLAVQNSVFAYIVSPIDTSRPVVSSAIIGTKGTHDWYTSNVSIIWTATDPQAPIGRKIGCGPKSVTADTSGQNFSCRAVSIGGSAIKSLTIKRDASKPIVSIMSPAPGAVFNRNQVVTANFACTDATAGMQSCVGTVGNGTRINTSQIVTNAKFKVTATDKAGLKRTLTATYSVK